MARHLTRRRAMQARATAQGRIAYGIAAACYSALAAWALSYAVPGIAKTLNGYGPAWYWPALFSAAYMACGMGAVICARRTRHYRAPLPPRC